MKAHYQLPVAAKHSPGKHASPWHKAVAEAGTILQSEIGSGLHGTAVAGYDDHDEMGVCVEPREAVIGFRSFEQYEWHTAWEREGGRKNRSGHGDTDTVVYSLRKWMRLAAGGNPSVLMLLFAPEDKLVKITPEGLELRERMTPFIVSRVAGARFAGYLHAQRQSMLSRDGKGRDVTRPELVAKYGFDTKFAGHMVRLGMQGAELLSSGKITLPMPAYARQVVVDIRNGKWDMASCLRLAEQYETEIKELCHPETGTSDLPLAPDWDKINEWVSDTYQWRWTVQGTVSW